MEYYVQPQDICAAVETILALTPEERQVRLMSVFYIKLYWSATFSRQERARQGRARYEEDLSYFAHTMEAFRQHLDKKSS
jgi:hypothetical protein